MPMDEEARKELKDAINILKSDGFHIHRTYPQFLKKQEEGEKAPPRDGDPPPPKEEPKK